MYRKLITTPPTPTRSYYIDDARYVAGPQSPAIIDAITVEDGATLGVAADHGVTLGSLTIGNAASLTASYRPYASNGLFKWRVTGTVSLAQSASLVSNTLHDLHLIVDSVALNMAGSSIVGHKLLRIEAPSLTMTGAATIDARQDVELHTPTFSCSANACM